MKILRMSLIAILTRLLIAAVGILIAGCAGFFDRAPEENIVPIEVSSMEKGDSAYERGELAAAALHYRESARKGEQPAIAWFNVANTLVRLERTTEAMAAYRESVREAPGFLRAYQNLAALYQLEGQWVLAAEAYRNATEIDPRDANSRFRLGEIAQKSGDCIEALKWYGHSIELDPDEDAAWSGLAQCHLQLRDTASAVLVMEKLNIRDNRHRGWALVLEGDLLSARGDIDGALRRYEDATLLDSTDRRSWLRMAKQLRASGRGEEAAVLLQSAAARNPTDGNYWAAIGNLRFEAGDPVGARTAFSRALRLGSSEGLQGLEMLRQWHDRRGDVQAVAAVSDSLALR
jgi:tetratricopeptide (TPR) repeat protein